MRWVRFEIGGVTSYGIVEREIVESVSGDPFDGYERTGRQWPLDEVRLRVPLEPKTFYAAGLNYAAHVTAAAALLGQAANLPAKPDIGYRAVNALIADGEDVIVPRDATEKVHYEGELVVVIGRTAKNLAPEEALSCVLGYSIGNDVSERTWQKQDRTLWRAKSSDTFKPMGPWIDTNVDLDALRTTVRVNGETTSTFETNDMIFGVATYISAMTRYITLFPGDMIWMGTDGTSPDLADGDLVEIDIDPIGTLSNRFVRER
jgi:2-keto-4-pentenoate hydratase/2-oxohepta-3-ene-1,7-dioic acid hydratase in catechol pathway